MEEKTVLIDYDILKHKSGKATLFVIGDEEKWIPNSLIIDVWENDNQIELPEWFCLKEGLI